MLICMLLVSVELMVMVAVLVLVSSFGWTETVIVSLPEPRVDVLSDRVTQFASQDICQLALLLMLKVWLSAFSLNERLLTDALRYLASGVGTGTSGSSSMK